MTVENSKGEMNTKVRLIYNGLTESDLARIARVSRGVDIDSLATASDDQRTISTLYRLGHFSVFEFADIVFQVDCPIFVARQLMRYRCASYLERSLRYCEPLEVEENDAYDELYNCSVASYRELRDGGEPKEEARRVLTLDAPTRIIMKVNLREFLHILDERLGPTAQKETRQVAWDMFNLAKGVYPLVLGMFYDTLNKKIDAFHNERAIAE